MVTTREIPTQMKAAAIDRFGDVVHIETLPIPKIGKHEILVQVATAGVGVWDPILIAGEFQDTKAHFPRVFGSDGSGTIVAIGADVKRFAIGDRVYGWGFANPKGGFFAEYIAIPDKDASHIPGTIAFDEAGALAVVGVTALQGLEQLDLKSNGNVIIFGASGGVGHVAIQLAKRLGLRVFAVASKADGVALAKQLGADGVIEGHSKALVQRATAFAPDKFAGALVFAGGDGWEDELEVVAKGAVVAYPNGIEPAPVVPKRAHRKAYDAENTPHVLARLNELIAQGPFHVVLSKLYALDDAAQALRDVQHHHLGKLALKIQ